MLSKNFILTFRSILWNINMQSKYQPIQTKLQLEDVFSLDVQLQKTEIAKASKVD